MSDQDDFDQTLTPSQEYTIAFFVILLFGLMYWYFTEGFQPSASPVVQSTEAPQASYALNNAKTSDPSSIGVASKSTPTEEISSVQNNSENTQSEEVVKADISDNQQNIISDQALDKEKNRLKVEAANLAAATTAQKALDEKRFNAKQLELTKGTTELVIPPKPNAADSGNANPKAIKTTQNPVISQTIAAQKSPESKAFDLSDELLRVNFKLPDGRTIQIPKQGFENQFKQSILQDSAGQSIVFDRVYFYPGSDMLNPESSNQILGVAGILNTYKDIKIKLRGHTDSTGPSESNLTLSFKRSLNLKKQLVGLGIDTQRIQVEGLGASEPISDNGSEKGRNQNRRIDLTIIR